MACSKMRAPDRLKAHGVVFASLYEDILGIFPIDTLLWYLYSKGIITNAHMDEILAEKTAAKQCTILLKQMIRTRKIDALEAFHDAVRDNYPWIATKIAQKIDFEQLHREMDDNDAVQRLIGLMTETLSCHDEEKRSDATSGYRDSGQESLYPGTSCSRSRCGGTSTCDEHIRTLTRPAMKRKCSCCETNSYMNKRQKAGNSTEVTWQKKEGKKPKFVAKVQDSLNKAGKMIKKTVFQRGSKKPTLERPVSPLLSPEHANMRLEAEMDLVKAALREASRKSDADALHAMLEDCEAYEPLQEDPEVHEALETLQSINSSREDLESACQNEDVDGIRRLIESVSQSKVAKFLQKELDDAKKLCLQLGPPSFRVPAMENTPFEMKRAIDEIKRSRSPSPIVINVMRAFLLLIGEREEEITVWKDMQKAIQRQSNGLYQRIANFKRGAGFSLTASKARALLVMNDQEVQTTSAAVYPFYAWTKRQLGKQH